MKLHLFLFFISFSFCNSFAFQEGQKPPLEVIVTKDSRVSVYCLYAAKGSNQIPSDQLSRCLRAYDRAQKFIKTKTVLPFSFVLDENEQFDDQQKYKNLKRVLGLQNPVPQTKKTINNRG